VIYLNAEEMWKLVIRESGRLTVEKSITPQHSSIADLAMRIVLEVLQSPRENRKPSCGYIKEKAKAILELCGDGE